MIQSENEHRQNTNPSHVAVAVAVVRAPVARAKNVLDGMADIVAAAEEGLEQAAGSFNSVAEICNDELKRCITVKSQDFQFKTGKKILKVNAFLVATIHLTGGKNFRISVPFLPGLQKCI